MAGSEKQQVWWKTNDQKKKNTNKDNPTHRVWNLFPTRKIMSNRNKSQAWTMPRISHLFSHLTELFFPGPWEPRHVYVFTFSLIPLLLLSHPLPLPGWWSDYPVAVCVSRQVRGQCVYKGLTSFSINIMTGLATFPRSTNNLRGGESGWSISSVCLLRSWPTLIP